jgi:stage II sporulation protein D
VTEDAVDVWGEDIPYLQSTQSPGEENAKNYVHTEIFPLGLFLEKLGIESAVSTSDLIGSTTYTAGGGVSTITIGKRNYKGTEIRQLLSLRSTAFSIAIVGDTVSVTTRGHGHRVGMSQYGAEAMAIQGSDYKQILQHYYKGTVLQRYY